AGTAPSVSQSTLNSVTQPTQFWRSPALDTGPLQAGPAGGTVTEGQCGVNPIWVPAKANGQPFAIVSFFLAIALLMASMYLPSPAAGGTQLLLCLPLRRPSQHLPIAFVFDAKKAAPAFPTAI